MKKAQKLIGILLVIMLISIQIIPIINVSAEETEVTEELIITTDSTKTLEDQSYELVTNTTTLTITSTTGVDTFSVYKTIDIYYSDPANSMVYEFTDNFKAFLNTESIKEEYPNFSIESYMALTSDLYTEDGVGYSEGDVITTSTLNVLLSKYATYVRTNEIEGLPLTTDGYDVYGEIEVGSYLILPDTINNQEFNDGISIFFKNLYGVMVANAVFTTDATGWKLEPCSVTVKKEFNILSSVLTDATLTEIEDYMLNSDGSEKPPAYQNYSGVLNKEYIYSVAPEIEEIPTNAINKTYQLEIIFPPTIDFAMENVYYFTSTGFTQITDNKMYNSDGVEIATTTFDETEQKLTINWTLVDSYDYMFCIKFELSDTATVGSLGNEFVSNFITPKDPYVADSTMVLTSTNIITTYGLELTSYGEENTDGTKPLLTGAKYEIYTTYTDSVLSNKIGEFTVGEDGKATFTGVPSGTIYLKQTKAPTGYQLIKDPIEVEIATENAIVGSGEGYYQTSTTNTAMWYLPTTGGIGTIIYTMIGLLIITVAVVGAVYYRKNQLKINN